MRVCWMTIVLAVSLGGCASGPQRYSVYFQPYSAAIDQQGLDTIHSAAQFAKDHPLQPVEILGSSAPPDPNQDVAGLSAARSVAVKQVLVSEGVGSLRIATLSKGIVDPKELPSVAVRRVDITIGQ